MAKELPYFKFCVADWLIGNIVYESFSVQGLFINICAIYWQRNGELSLEDINKRFKNPDELNSLSGRYFSLSDGWISIKFLDEQLQERKIISKTNSKNAKIGVAAKALKNMEVDSGRLAVAENGTANVSNIEKKREEKKRENNIKGLIDFFSLEDESIRINALELLADESWIEKIWVTIQMEPEYGYKCLGKFIDKESLMPEWTSRNPLEIKKHFVNNITLVAKGYHEKIAKEKIRSQNKGVVRRPLHDQPAN